MKRSVNQKHRQRKGSGGPTSSFEQVDASGSNGAKGEGLEGQRSCPPFLGLNGKRAITDGRRCQMAGTRTTFFVAVQRTHYSSGRTCTGFGCGDGSASSSSRMLTWHRAHAPPVVSSYTRAAVTPPARGRLRRGRGPLPPCADIPAGTPGPLKRG